MRMKSTFKVLAYAIGVAGMMMVSGLSKAVEFTIRVP